MAITMPMPKSTAEPTPAVMSAADRDRFSFFLFELDDSDVGDEVGVGFEDGWTVGGVAAVGDGDGTLVKIAVGWTVGAAAAVGNGDGALVGIAVVGALVGIAVVGASVGFEVVGALEGSAVTNTLGLAYVVKPANWPASG